jgi:hypothetical protein
VAGAHAPAKLLGQQRAARSHYESRQRLFANSPSPRRHSYPSLGKDELPRIAIRVGPEAACEETGTSRFCRSSKQARPRRMGRTHEEIGLPIRRSDKRGFRELTNIRGAILEAFGKGATKRDANRSIQGSRQPVREAAHRARYFDRDCDPRTSSGPAAICAASQRPDIWKHPTEMRSTPKVPLPERGVHICFAM